MESEGISHQPHDSRYNGSKKSRFVRLPPKVVIVHPGPSMQPTVLTGYDLSTISAVQVSESTQQTPGTFPTVSGKTLRENLIYKLTLGVTMEAEQDIPNALGKIALAMGTGSPES
jgi:hypothetical protein